ncbi:zinc-dependent alcohol dehydrogenase [Amycolatopsis pithecellobii]|uniref:Alcohol dehydrogenase catalytic domain-containing protein n=1 Tax=Amycolatopsis pithecellobii TaxID=664692 RepID=A0A6N7Z6M8_9PSEU|nr:alcohol dehydrogenase catalytic domain-containing protein [Amycolatopsis pithecellobii]MTD55256.1 alcohol dehydrogenase catalytic domain-containing protein [Amycolatopsis pithecellobii]
MSPDTMLAARLESGATTVNLTRVPVPQPGPNDVLIRVASAGLATGVMRLAAMGAFPVLPTTLGHEAAGTVAAVGAEVADIAVGTRVRLHPNLACRQCVYCTTDREMMCAQQALVGHAAFATGPRPLYDAYHDGGLAEFVRVPHWLVDPLPDGVGFDVGAKVHDLANALRALKCAGLAPGSTLVITAATGTMGTATVTLAPQFGVARLVLVGRNAKRLAAVGELAGTLPTDLVALEDLPADWTTGGGLTTALQRLVPGGADAVLDFSPAGPAGGQALLSMATGATYVHMGGNLENQLAPVSAMMARCWRFVGTRANTRADVHDVLRLLESGVITADRLITHRYPLDQIDQALAALHSRTEPIWMAVVNPAQLESP